MDEHFEINWINLIFYSVRFHWFRVVLNSIWALARNPLFFPPFSSVLNLSFVGIATGLICSVIERVSQVLVSPLKHHWRDRRSPTLKTSPQFFFFSYFVFTVYGGHNYLWIPSIKLWYYHCIHATAVSTCDSSDADAGVAASSKPIVFCSSLHICRFFSLISFLNFCICSCNL